MKQITRIFTLLLLFTFVFGVMTADAQRTRKRDSTEEYFDESGGFAHRLWYGGGFNLNFSGTVFGNVMVIGVSPMVGYKINDILSIGPRASLDYTEFFGDGTNPRYLSWGLGPFARGKFSETIFAHVEYQVTGTTGLNSASDFIPFADERSNFFLGAGYQSSGGGLFGYEIVALYNFLEDSEFNIPISFRVGVNWNF